MRLFGKSVSKNKKDEITEVKPPVISQSTGMFDTNEVLTPHEAAQCWFLRRYGEPLPQELQTWFDALAQMKTEASNDKLQRLDKQDLKKIEDGMLLCKTQLNNVDENIHSIWQQESKNREIEELTKRLEACQKNFHNINKLYTSVLIQARDLQRYETFEPIQGNFQRILVLEEELRRKTKLQVDAVRALEESKKNFKTQQEVLNVCKQQRIEAEVQAQKAQNFLNENYHIQGVLNKLDKEWKNLSEKEHRINLILSEHTKKSTEQKQDFERLKNKQEELVIEKRKHEIFQNLYEKSQTILVLLEFLSEVGDKKERLRKTLNEIRKRQTEQNELLNKLFSQYQERENNLSKLQNELKVSLQQNSGEDSFHLQQRATDLRGKHQMLVSACALWKKISEGYHIINETTQEISRIQINVDSIGIHIQKLEIEEKDLCKRFEQMQYSYILNKSTDLLKLRKDLREGCSCSVCGAAHHPYHSETELAQGVLISQLRADYEATRKELESKQQVLQQTKMLHAKEQGALEIKQHMLDYLKKNHHTNVGEWSVFAFLDRSFSDCTPSTNREARMKQLQQLIENTAQDSAAAQTQLDTFNFHQNTINKINKEIAKQEMAKDELVIRLNEINTECQVLAYQVEKHEKEYKYTNERYGELYTKLDGLISYPQWHNKWLENPENLKIKIQEQSDYWKTLNNKLIANELMLAQKQIDIEVFRKSIEMQRGILDEIKVRMQQIKELQNDLHNQLYKMFGDEPPQAYYTKRVQQVDMLRKKEELQSETTNQAAIEEQKWNEHHSYLIAMKGELETMCKEERVQLDLWIRKYNADHSPVQYAELQRIFMAKTDWNALRQNIRRIELENNMAQKAIDDLNSRLARLQTNTLQSEAINKKNENTILLSKRELEDKRFAILKQLVLYESKLLLHQQCVAREQHLKSELNAQCYE